MIRQVCYAPAEGGARWQPILLEIAIRAVALVAPGIHRATHHGTVGIRAEHNCTKHGTRHEQPTRATARIQHGVTARHCGEIGGQQRALRWHGRGAEVSPLWQREPVKQLAGAARKLAPEHKHTIPAPAPAPAPVTIPMHIMCTRILVTLIVGVTMGVAALNTLTTGSSSHGLSRRSTSRTCPCEIRAVRAAIVYVVQHTVRTLHAHAPTQAAQGQQSRARAPLRPSRGAATDAGGTNTIRLRRHLRACAGRWHARGTATIVVVPYPACPRQTRRAGQASDAGTRCDDTGGAQRQCMAGTPHL